MIVNSPSATAIYLGDGAYVSLQDADLSGRYGSIVVTAGHHEPQKADHMVWLDKSAAIHLVAFIERHKDKLP